MVPPSSGTSHQAPYRAQTSLKRDSLTDSSRSAFQRSVPARFIPRQKTEPPRPTPIRRRPNLHSVPSARLCSECNSGRIPPQAQRIASRFSLRTRQRLPRVPVSNQPQRPVRKTRGRIGCTQGKGARHDPPARDQRCLDSHRRRDHVRVPPLRRRVGQRRFATHFM